MTTIRKPAGAPTRSSPRTAAETKKAAAAKATASAPGWKPAAKDWGHMPMSAFEATVGKATVRELINIRSGLDGAYQLARRDETKPANRDVIRRWDIVDQRIDKLSGPDGGE